MKYYEETLPDGRKRTFIGSPPARPLGNVIELLDKPSTKASKQRPFLTGFAIGCIVMYGVLKWLSL